MTVDLTELSGIPGTGELDCRTLGKGKLPGMSVGEVGRLLVGVGRLLVGELAIIAIAGSAMVGSVI